MATTHPGEPVDIAVECTAPVLPGTSVAHFKLADAAGRLYFPHINPEGIMLSITVTN